MTDPTKPIIPIDLIKPKIYLIRGCNVMLDRDLAALYGIKPIRLREQVRRNLKRFPEDFMIQLDDPEISDMVSQNAIPSKQHLGGSNPVGFTEHDADIQSIFKAIRRLMGPDPSTEKRPIGFGI